MGEGDGEEIEGGGHRYSLLLMYVGSYADRSTLIKVQFSALSTAAKRGTLNETEATHQCMHDQQKSLKSLEAAN